ncbi:uncharacterized protein MELLADRAFT_90001 [Melampsora larici-populina 98AG31]|uniref:FAD-binding PCMH-type domain-containing protein n=1 Tax=Melampsora larici-populina (strain 98AG31 / pathotype 3-4-7) TaxID=747676 RepID=F4RVD8_MELLP|nr:uncharacterized protein MELLADRAFT_90001 [Melampsora larici-populina 98AG31]EGG03687.1 hypothetical protein MELLADRAFT_90001 [Melampsora larici-populina 98AG31]
MKHLLIFKSSSSRTHLGHENIANQHEVHSNIVAGCGIKQLATSNTFFVVLNTQRANTASLRAKFSKLGIDAVFPGDSSFEKFAAPFNKRLSYIPAAIVFPNHTEAVSNCVKVAVEEKLPVSTRSGGHLYAAYGLGGGNGALVVDVSRLKTIFVHQSTGQAVIGTGNRLGDMAIGLYSQGGRAIPHGTCPYVGIGGHAAFGGFGTTSRMWGLTLDNIIGHEVVLANGTIVQASQDSNPDLFWALRGAGASYGIMTSIKFQTHSAPSQATNFHIKWYLSQNELANALLKFQVFCRSNLPSELAIDANLKKAPKSGLLVFSLVGTWNGEESKFAAVIQPLLDGMPAPIESLVKRNDWLDSLQTSARSDNLSTSGVDLSAEHDTFYAKSLTTPQSTPMSNSSIQAFTEYLASEGLKTDTVRNGLTVYSILNYSFVIICIKQNWFVQFELYGGQNSAITSVAKDATAFAQRSILFTIQFYTSSSNYSPPFPDAGLTFLDQMVAAIVNNGPSGWEYGAYSNYVDARLSSNEWKNLYYNTHYQRLTQTKVAYDPQNIFSYPQSIGE